MRCDKCSNPADHVRPFGVNVRLCTGCWPAWLAWFNRA